jgi:hypothetical protein
MIARPHGFVGGDVIQAIVSVDVDYDQDRSTARIISVEDAASVVIVDSAGQRQTDAGEGDRAVAVGIRP